ncbi:MAG: pentapeptide repeat-containing protein [Candidatus Caenarcaniphilales bacterium]|nr:pentapeptide repeat-containing protein [Candidatus Caenarcaniphilales bacterium]
MPFLWYEGGMWQTILISVLGVLLASGLVIAVLFLLRIAYLLNRFSSSFQETFSSKDILLRAEVNAFITNLQDAVESGSENEEYSEIEINPGKFQILHGRLKSICNRADPYSRGYILSTLIHCGLANNPFILEELDFTGAICIDELFFGADLSRIVGRGINFRGSVLSEARLENAKISFTDLTGARLDEAKLSGAYLNESILQNAYLKGADLQRSYLIGADLRQAYLGEAEIDGAILRQANLMGANLNFCRMAAVNFSEANLSKSILRESYMSGATLREADLTSAYLTSSDLDGADLWKANLAHAIFPGTNFHGVYLNEARFHGVYRDLIECDNLELDRLQEKESFGLYCSAPTSKFGIEKATNFYKCQWWLANFDRVAAQTLLPFLKQHFAPPNGLDLTNADWLEFRQFEEKIEKLIKG